ncbi:hypothetical protein Syun_025115 [Stephania yunnanensis]|uniref:Uncharacterized protein n=1 Tax=Stephania yunnanensis TaxID=152371 RepID=A0AAP0HVX8_9MAGN
MVVLLFYGCFRFSWEQSKDGLLLMLVTVWGKEIKDVNDNGKREIIATDFVIGVFIIKGKFELLIVLYLGFFEDPKSRI